MTSKIKGSLIAAALLIGTFTTQAELTSKSKDIIVEQPADLPELAQHVGLAMKLHSLSDGRSFLYVEQHHGERLVVFDVSDPAHIRMVAAVKLTVPSTYEFVRPLGDSAELVRFHDNLGVAVLDLRKPTEPALMTLSGLKLPGHTEPIGATGFLMVNEPHIYTTIAPHDYQIIDTSNPAVPELMGTIKMVADKISLDETGSTFFLGSDGLTVIRRPEMERKHVADEEATSRN